MKTRHRYAILFRMGFFKGEITWEDEPSPSHRLNSLPCEQILLMLDIWCILFMHFIFNSVHATHCCPEKNGWDFRTKKIQIMNCFSRYYYPLPLQYIFAFLGFSRWPRWMEFYRVLCTSGVQWKWDNMPMQSSYTFWCTDGNWESPCVLYLKFKKIRREYMCSAYHS